MKRIVVFGATGNIGAYSAVYLKEQGYEVIAVGRRQSDNGFYATKGVPYYSVDIKDRASFEVLPKEDVYAVVHFASTLPSRYAFDPQEMFESIKKT